MSKSCTCLETFESVDLLDSKDLELCEKRHGLLDLVFALSHNMLE